MRQERVDKRQQRVDPVQRRAARAFMKEEILFIDQNQMVVNGKGDFSGVAFNSANLLERHVEPQRLERAHHQIGRLTNRVDVDFIAMIANGALEHGSGIGDFRADDNPGGL